MGPWEYLAALTVFLAVLVLCGQGLLSPFVRRRQPWSPHLRGGWGTVYIFEDREDPSLVKLGYTGRLSKIRKRELGGKKLRQVYGLDMPFAITVENRVHLQLGRWREPGRRLERYRLTDSFTLTDLINRVEAEAAAVRVEAGRKGDWPYAYDVRTKIWWLTPAGVVKSHPFSMETSHDA